MCCSEVIGFPEHCVPKVAIVTVRPYSGVVLTFAIGISSDAATTC
jgi:hypothetical protein